MRNATRNKLVLYATGEWIYFGCAAAAVFTGWLSGYNITEDFRETRPMWTHVLTKFRDYSIGIYLGLAVLLVISFLMKRWGDAWVLEKIQYILDEYQGAAFRKQDQPVPADHNRVTLFQHKRNRLLVRHWSATKWYQPWGDVPFRSDYLIPILRSGHISKKTRVAFYAPDDSDKAEGVATQAWASKKTVEVRDLPHVHKNCRKRDKIEYAQSTYCKQAMLDRRIDEGRKMARCIVAIPVEMKGKIWGVVVLDSRSPDGVSENAADHYKLAVALIGHLLERA